MYSIFFLTFLISIALTLVVKYFALKFSVIDYPDTGRKIHKQSTPLLGGVAIFFSFFFMLFLNQNDILARGLTGAHLGGFFLGALIIIIGGALDDVFNLKARQQIIFPVLACGFVLAGGIGISKITNPLGGAGELLYFSGAVSALLTVIWLLGMIYTTKLLDGVDGLVSGLGVISGLVIFLFTITTKYYQPDVGLIALIFAAACLGFWLFNFYPAKIFLGESGSLLIGYVIGILAIISGGKIAIALLIMGMPILDVAWVILRRLRQRKNPFTTPDCLHLHHRLLSAGLNERQTVFVYYILAAVFGLSALWLQSRGKLLALGVLAAVIVAISLWSVFLPRSKSIQNKNY